MSATSLEKYSAMKHSKDTREYDKNVILMREVTRLKNMQKNTFIPDKDDRTVYRTGKPLSVILKRDKKNPNKIQAITYIGPR